MIVTFYSFKGGVGRSMALANVAEILADLGYHVIACDWDLEAPGLERYLAATKEESDRLAVSPGLMDLLIEYKALLSASTEVVDTSDTHARVGDLRLRRPSSRAVPISTWKKRSGSLRLLTAGRRGAQYSTYAEAVRTFDWDNFYKEWAGGAYMDFFLAELSAGRPEDHESGPLTGAADIVLIDSRTGVTEHGGVATHHLADAVVLLSAANDLNLDGTTWMANALFKKELTELRGGRPLSILPIATRIEQTSEKNLVSQFRRVFSERFSPYLPHVLGTPSEFFLDSEIPYLPFYSFTERVAASESPDVRDEWLFRKYETLAHALIECGLAARLLPASSIPPSVRLRSTERVVEPPRGTFAFHAADSDRSIAAGLAAVLSAEGVSILPDDIPSGQSSSGTHKLSGAIILISPATPLEWVSAVVDESFRKVALDPEFRIVPVVAGNVPFEALRRLERLRVVTVSGDQADFQVGPVISALAARSTVATTDEPGRAPSLDPFDESGARFFFGRDHDLVRLGSMISGASPPARWIQIEGAPGVGKTSFVRASVVPALRRGVLGRGMVVGPVAFTSLTKDPSGALAVALTAAAKTEHTAAETRARLLESQSYLGDFIRDASPAGCTFILVVDDVEPTTAHIDVMRMALAAARRGDVPLLLITIGTSGTPGHEDTSIPGTVRYELQPITLAESVKVASTQAAVAGLTVERQVWDAMTRDLQELGAAVNVAPLLQLMLITLSRRAAGAPVTLDLYERIGGPLATLVTEADAKLSSFSPDRLARAQRLLVGLTASTPDGAPTARPIPHAEALRLADGDAELLELLSSHPGIIRADTEVALTHPVLVDRWDRLRRWIEKDRKGALIRSRNRWVAGIAAAAVVVIVATYAVQSRTEERLNAVRTSEYLALQARQTLETDAVRGLALAVSAADTAETEAATEVLNLALTTVRYPNVVLDHPAPVTDAEFSPDATRVITGAEDAVRIWEALDGTSPGKVTARQTIPAQARVTSVRFSPDGRYAGATMFEGSPVLIDLRTQNVTELTGHSGAVLDSSFSADGRFFVTAGFEGTALVWEAATGRLIRELRQKASMTSASFSPDASEILTTSLDGTATIWSADGRIVQQLTGSDASGFEAGRFGGPYVAIGGPDGVLLKAADKSAPVRFPVASGDSPGFSLSPNGRTLAIAAGGMIDVFFPSQPTPVVRPEGTSGAVITDIALDHDGRYLAAGTVEGSVFLWDLAVAKPAMLRGHRAAISRVRFSPDGKRLLTASEDGTAAVWNVAAPSPPPDRSFAALREAAHSQASRLLTREQLATIAGR